MSSPLAVISWKPTWLGPSYRDSKVIGLECNHDTDILKLLRDSNWQPSLQTLGLQQYHPRHRRLTFIPILNSPKSDTDRSFLQNTLMSKKAWCVAFSLSLLSLSPKSCIVPLRVSNSQILTSKKLRGARSYMNKSVHFHCCLFYLRLFTLPSITVLTAGSRHPGFHFPDQNTWTQRDKHKHAGSQVSTPKPDLFSPLIS